MNLFETGEFTLSSGIPSWWKINCDALTDEDIKTIAMLLTSHLPKFGSVEGVPTGGLRLAKAMEQYITTGPLLIVDDVCTTGHSMNKHRAGRWPAIGAVIFARYPVYSWIYALWSLELDRRLPKGK